MCAQLSALVGGLIGALELRLGGDEFTWRIYGRKISGENKGSWFRLIVIGRFGIFCLSV